MAKVAMFPKEYRVGRRVGTLGERRSTRGTKARATRFANDVNDFCKWYFKGTNRAKRTKVNEYVEWLLSRSRQAGSTRT